MGEPPVREQDRLGALEMGVAGHQQPKIDFGALDESALQIAQDAFQDRQVVEHPQSKIGGNLIVAAAPGVQFAADRPYQFFQAALHSGVNVFIFFLEDKRTLLKLSQHFLKPGAQFSAFHSGQNTSGFNGFGPGDAAAHILFGHTLVEGQRGVQQPGLGVEFAAKTAAPEGHGKSFLLSDWVILRLGD